MINKNKYLGLSAILTLLIFICIFFLIKTAEKKINFTPINFNNYIDSYRSYLLTGKDLNMYTSISSMEYPYVRVAPWSKKYFITQWLESVDLINGKYDELFFSNKRIAELMKWGNELTILETFDTTNNKMSQNKSADYSSWESIFTRYMLLMETKINKTINAKINNKSQLLQLRGYLEKNNNTILQTIYNLKVNNDKKQYLYRINSRIFSYLNKIIPNDIVYPNPTIAEYSLDKLNKNNDYGLYDLTVNLSNKINIPGDQLLLSINNKTPLIENSIKDLKKYYRNISLDSNSRSLFLQIPKINNINKNEIKYGSNTMVFKIPPEKIPSTVLLSLNYHFPHPVTITVEQTYKENNTITKTLDNSEFMNFIKLVVDFIKRTVPMKNVIFKNQEEVKNETILNEFLDPSNNNISFVRILKFHDDRELIDVRITLSSTQPFSAESIESTDLVFTPVYIPDIQIKKTSSFKSQRKILYYRKGNYSYSIYITNTNTDEDDYIVNSLHFGWKIDSKQHLNNNHYKLNIIYWPLPFLRNFVLISIFVFLLFLLYLLAKYFAEKRMLQIEITFTKKYKKIYKEICQILNIVKTTVIYIYKIFKILSYKIKFFTLCLALFGTFLHIFIVPIRHDFLILNIITLWLISLIGYNAKKETCFKIAFFFVAFSFVCSILGLANQAELTSVWAVYFLIIGTIQITVSMLLKYEE